MKKPFRLLSLLLCLQALGAMLTTPAHAAQYTALGDSLTRGTNAGDGSDTAPRTGFVDAVDDVSNSVERFLDANREATTLTNLGERGATASTVRANQLAAATSGSVATGGAPNVATLTVGANDVVSTALQAQAAQQGGATPAQVEAGVASAIAAFRTNYDSILNGLRGAASNPFIVVANVPDLSLLPIANIYAPTPVQKAQLQQIVNRYNTEIAGSASARSVPVANLFAATASQIVGNTASDGFHPNATGYAAIANLFNAFLGSTQTVLNTADSGTGSLRQALLDANRLPGADTINFAIPAAQADANGVFTIAPASALPTIIGPVAINGYSQAGASRNTLPLAGGTNAVLKIALNGALAGAGSNGLLFAAGSDASSVSGLVINGFLPARNTGGVGVGISGANGVTVEGCFIGTSAEGTGTNVIGGLSTPVVGNTSGVAVLDGVGCVIGGVDVGARNLISNNTAPGVNLSNAPTSSTPNRVLNNLIGTTASGAAVLGNGTGSGEGALPGGPLAASSGVFVANSAGTIIGSVGAGNVIAGNSGLGVLIDQDSPGLPSVGNQVLANFIGVAGDGTTALPNTGDGIEIVSSLGTVVGGPGSGNVIRFNTGNGVAIVGNLVVAGGGVDNSVVSSNLISNNMLDGILITGGVGHTLTQNSITANSQEGIDLGGDGITLNDAGDADTGPNNRQNFPVVTAATTSGAVTTLSGTLDSPAGSYRIEYFANIVADTLGNGEGLTFLGGVSTTGAGAAFVAPVTIPAGQFFLTATATNTATGDTSEFSTALLFNRPPVNSVPASASTPEDIALVFSAANSNAITVSDPDAGNAAVTVTLSVANGVLTLSQTTGLAFTAGDGTADATMTFGGTLANINAALNGLRFDPTPNASGLSTLSITSNDGGATGQSGPQQDTDAVPITIAPVNDAPVAQDQSVGTQEDTALPITLTATDIDSSTLSYAIVSGPSHGTLSGTGAIRTYTPAQDYNGPDSFTFQANDGALNSNVATIAITVGGQNDAPVAVADSATANEDTPLSVLVLANDTDAENDPLTVARVAATAATHGTVTIPADKKSVRYVPEADYFGTATFTYTVSDGTLEATTTVTITVRPVNDAPQALNQSLAATTRAVLPITLTATDIDSPQSGLTFTVLSQPANGTLSGSGANLRYRARPGYSGTDSFTFRASDGTLNSDVATITLRVSDTNRAPVAAADNASTPINAPVAVQVLANDSDADGDTLSISAVDAAGTRGTLSISSDKRSVLFTPESGFSGSTSFGYTISDGVASASARVAVQVLASPTIPNRAPVAVADAYSTQGTLQVLAADGVLKNDTDADGQALTTILQSTTSHGEVKLDRDGSFTYTPAVGYTGPDAFTYSAFDGTAQSTIVTVSLSVTSTPDVTPPVLALAGEGVRTLARLEPVRGSAADVYVLRSGPVVSSGLRSVVVRLQRSNGDYWNGRAYQRAPFNLPVQQQARSFFVVASSVMPPLSQAAGGRYRWTALATDNAGNTSQAQQFVLVDSVAPSVAITTPATGSDGVARVLRLESVAGRVSEAARLDLFLRRIDGQYWNGRSYQVAATFLSVRSTGGAWNFPASALPSGQNLVPGRYSLTVRATDSVGNVATMQRSVEVASTPVR